MIEIGKNVIIYEKLFFGPIKNHTGDNYIFWSVEGQVNTLKPWPYKRGGDVQPQTPFQQYYGEVSKAEH